MKKFKLTILLLVGLSSLSFGQNVFPTTGKVGIGTTSPNADLRIKSASYDSYQLRITTPCNDCPTGVDFHPLIVGTGNVAIGIPGDFSTMPSLINNRLVVNGRIASYFNSDPNSFTALENSGLEVKTNAVRTFLISNGNLYGYSSTGTNNYSLKSSGELFARSISIKNSSNVQNFKVSNNGFVYARQIEVQGSGNFPDYVFEDDYKLRSLEELEAYINENKHLPEIPSAQEVNEKGINLGQMNELLLKKIEELTLYVIEQDKKIKELSDLIKN